MGIMCQDNSTCRYGSVELLDVGYIKVSSGVDCGFLNTTEFLNYLVGRYNFPLFTETT